MFFILCGLLIGVIILFRTKKEDFVFGLLQVVFFACLGLFISVIISYTNIIPKTKTLVDTINLEEISSNVYLELEEESDINNLIKSYSLTFINSGKEETKTNIINIKINVNIPEDGLPYINIYKDKFSKDFYKYFFFESDKYYYELNINPTTYKNLNV